MKVSPNVDKTKYCRFHRYVGHDTDEWNVLKRQIEELIQIGYFKQFVKQPGQQQPHNPPNNVWRKVDGSEPSTSNARKREHDQITEVDEVEKEAEEPGNTRSRRYISFMGDSREETHRLKERNGVAKGPLPHRDALVIKMDINDTIVHRILVDTGSSANVMYYNAFTKLGLPRSQLKEVRTPLYGFTGDSIETEGSVILPVEIGTSPNV
ncbi:uncharacterized protein LOC116024156 [Ipomoea triloba]|uniref:uncharacterized protein LOC116024156 n=1 Tax=Ipomoea triloba TaxID=35885 RepID=UPI00125DAD78|nr:uncharacterized protein LOC116024156 [Ipomoea triloba]